MSDLQLSNELGFLRICGAVPELHVADIDYNVGNIIEAMKKAQNEGVQVLIFPEMAITGLHDRRPGATPGIAVKSYERIALHTGGKCREPYASDNGDTT